MGSGDLGIVIPTYPEGSKSAKAGQRDRAQEKVMGSETPAKPRCLPPTAEALLLQSAPTWITWLMRTGEEQPGFVRMALEITSQ